MTDSDNIGGPATLGRENRSNGDKLSWQRVKFGGQHTQRDKLHRLATGPPPLPHSLARPPKPTAVPAQFLSRGRAERAAWPGFRIVPSSTSDVGPAGTGRRKRVSSCPTRTRGCAVHTARRTSRPRPWRSRTT